jgi:hypothetical protein
MRVYKFRWEENGGACILLLNAKNAHEALENFEQNYRKEVKGNHFDMHYMETLPDEGVRVV